MELNEINNFQQYLESIGFVKCVVEYKDKIHTCRLAKENDYLSTMGILTFSYFKDVNDFNKYFAERWEWGLCESNKPPTLDSPRPFYSYNKINQIGIPGDDLMNKILLSYSFEDIYDCVINKKIINIDYKQIKH
jgi:hypothetical protein